MPLLAHFEELEPKSDRRRSPRRALKLGATSDGEPVTVHDLSLTGALLETSVPMLVGAALEVELPLAGRVEASIVWSSGEFYGCQFNLPIAPSALSAALLQSPPPSSEDRPDPLAELRELSTEIERLSLKMDSALRRLTRRNGAG
jgi:PilZ domain